MQYLCECMNIDCETDCDARERQLRSCRGHHITQGRHWVSVSYVVCMEVSEVCVVVYLSVMSLSEKT